MFDGVFLFRPELDDYWDFRIFIDVGFDETIRRAVKRDRDLFGSEDEVIKRYRNRYIPGQRLYIEKVCPGEKADVIVINNDPQNPELEIRK